MSTKRNRLAIGLSLISLTGMSFFSTAAHSTAQNTGNKGANIYCFMRSSGNEHEVSWKASYALMKRQTSSIFKTSPQHAAVMIIEAVVGDPTKYKNCGRYLGDLFGASGKINSPAKITEIKGSKKSPKELNENRYSY